jgi:tetratricopeptide (TPR) repeat protein
MPLLALAAAGCGAVRSPGATEPPASQSPAAGDRQLDASRGARESLEHYVARIRALTEKAAAERRRPSLLSVEVFDPKLREALARLSATPTPEQHRDVAAAYRRVGIADFAFDHYTAAVRLDRTDAAAYDGLARIWRDWGWPHLALVEAHRAVFHDPRSPAVRNTLGTVLQALGQHDAARREYEAVLAIDPNAAYALNNLCTLDLAAGRLSAAAVACAGALRIDPTLLAARRNLAALHAARPVAEPRTAETHQVPDSPSAAPSARPPGE